MLSPRIIPCLLIQDGGLVKTIGFREPKYVGDPINAVRIFNEMEADELIVLDIDATVLGREPDYGLLHRLAVECRMPLCYGGGISSADQARRIIELGVEKVSISSAALASPDLVANTAAALGRQSVVVTLDLVRRRGLRAKGYALSTHRNARRVDLDPLSVAIKMQSRGAGEVVFNSVDRDGGMKGYDLQFAQRARSELEIPITFLGGAGDLNDIEDLIATCGVSGAAAGSLFVFRGPYRAVLINYPAREVRESLCRRGLMRHTA